MASIFHDEGLNWLRDKIETQTPRQYNQQRRGVILDRLIWSTKFERFLATEWAEAKIFGLGGGETLIPGMKEMIDTSADLGVESIVIGMFCSGRMNALVNVLRKPLRQIFCELSGDTRPIENVGLYTGTGEVENHVGTSSVRLTRGGKRIHLSLVANLTKAGAVKVMKTIDDRTINMCILIYADPSSASQLYANTHHLTSVDPNITTGGTIHIVVCNAIADVMGGVDDLLIFNVDGNDMEAVVHVCELAAEWRQTFHSDVVIHILYSDYISSRNETDEPSFTQTKLNKVIQNRPSALAMYQKKLLETGQVTQEDIDRINSKVDAIINKEFFISKDHSKGAPSIEPFNTFFRLPTVVKEESARAVMGS